MAKSKPEKAKPAASKKKVAKKKVAKKKAVKKAAPRKTASKKPVTTKKASKVDITSQQRDEMIAVAAYYRWEQSGCVTELEVEHWLLAEQDIDSLLGQS